MNKKLRVEMKDSALPGMRWQEDVSGMLGAMNTSRQTTPIRYFGKLGIPRGAIDSCHGQCLNEVHTGLKHGRFRASERPGECNEGRASRYLGQCLNEVHTGLELSHFRAGERLGDGDVLNDGRPETLQ